jgi:O-antigen ligase
VPQQQSLITWLVFRLFHAISLNPSTLKGLMGMHLMLRTQFAKARIAPAERHAWVWRLGWLLFLVVVLRSEIFIRQRYVGAYAEVDTHNLVNIICTFAMAMIVTIKWPDVVQRIREGRIVIGCITIYYVVCAVAGLSSPSPAYPAFRAFEFLTFLFATMLLVGRHASFLTAERLTLGSISLILVMQIAGAIRLGGWGALHTNRYTVTAAMLFVYCFAEFTSATGRRKQLLVVISAMGLGGVLLGTSTGTNLAMAAGLVVLLMLSPRHRRYGLFIALSLPVLLMVADWDRVLQFGLGGKTPEEVVSLQHRGGIWTDSWDLFTQRPLLGYGLNVATREYTRTLSSHNAYLEALLGGGILGAGVLFCGCLALLRDLWQSARRRATGALGCCIATVVYLINGVSAPTIGYVLLPHGIVFGFILAMFVHFVKCPHQRVCAARHVPPTQFVRGQCPSARERSSTCV